MLAIWEQISGLIYFIRKESRLIISVCLSPPQLDSKTSNRFAWNLVWTLSHWKKTRAHFSYNQQQYKMVGTETCEMGEILVHSIYGTKIMYGNTCSKKCTTSYCTDSLHKTDIFSLLSAGCNQLIVATKDVKFETHTNRKLTYTFYMKYSNPLFIWNI